MGLDTVSAAQLIDERKETMQNTGMAGADVLGSGSPIPCLIKDEREADAVIPVGLLRNIAPSGMAAENPKFAAIDSRLRAVQVLRKDVQRAFTGAKAKNVRHYADYIHGGLNGEWPLAVPAIHIWHPDRLSYVEYPPGQRSIMWPHGDIGVCIDGETQREAWEVVIGQYGNASAASRKISITIHHGKPLAEVREIFYLYNVMEVKPSASIAISMDPRDLATKISRSVIESSEILHERVSMTGRSAKGSDIMTLAAVRNGIMTTLRGRAGLQVGSRRMGLQLEEEGNEEIIRQGAVDIWRTILKEFKNEFDLARENKLVIASPSILAGIGAVAHHAMPQPPRDPSYDAWTIEQLIATLKTVNWRSKEEGPNGPFYPWDGVGGRVNATGTFTVSGPKEVGHQIAFAIANPDSEAGRKIRARA